MEKRRKMSDRASSILVSSGANPTKPDKARQVGPEDLHMLQTTGTDQNQDGDAPGESM